MNETMAMTPPPVSPARRRMPHEPLWRVAWRRWGHLTPWIVPAALATAVAGIAGCFLAAKGSVLENLAFLALLLLAALTALGVAVTAAALFIGFARRQYEIAKQRWQWRRA